MSTPRNPLDIFRTYTYHHVLLACANQNVADEFTNSNNSDFNYFLNNRTPDTGSRFEVNNGEYAILIDSRVDADLVFDEINFTTNVAPNGDNQQALMFTAEGTMEIIEHRGMHFLNNLAKVASSFQQDIFNVIFVLKTYFVGVTEDNTTDVISTVKPNMFKIDQFDTKVIGGSAYYSLSILGLVNGVVHKTQFNNPANFSNISIRGPSPRVKTALLGFFRKLNAESKRCFDERRASKNNNDEEEKLLQYRIIVNEAFDDCIMDFSTIGEQQAGKKSGYVINFGQYSTVPDAINHIMLRCSEILNKVECKSDGEKNNIGASKRITYKITNSIRDDGNTTIAEYSINPYELPLAPANEATKVSDAVINEISQQNNYIEFDYTFTGKNIDILDLDLKFGNGLAFIQLYRSTDSSVTESTREDPTGTAAQNMSISCNEPIQNDGTNAKEVTVDTTNSNLEKPKKPSKEPCHSAEAVKETKLSIQNTTKSKQLLNYRDALAKFIGMDALQLNIKITGNVKLLDEITLNPAEVSNQELEVTSKVEGDGVIRNWQTGPMYVKLNIKFPETVDGFNTGPYTNFWYRGLYYITTITSSFKDGEFTQVLEILSLNSENSTISFDQSTDNVSPVPTGEGSTSTATQESTIQKPIAESSGIGGPPTPFTRKQLKAIALQAIKDRIVINFNSSIITENHVVTTTITEFKTRKGIDRLVRLNNSVVNENNRIQELKDKGATTEDIEKIAKIIKLKALVGDFLPPGASIL